MDLFFWQFLKNRQKHGERAVPGLEPATSCHSPFIAWCSLDRHKTPRRPIHPIGARVLTEPPKVPFGAIQTVQSQWRRKKIHVHKQVVQENARKNTLKFNHLAMSWWSWSWYIMLPRWFQTNAAWISILAIIKKSYPRHQKSGFINFIFFDIFLHCNREKPPPSSACPWGRPWVNFGCICQTLVWSKQI